MATVKQKVLALAAELNVDVDASGSGSDFEITLDAPTGHHFKGHPVHQIVLSIWDDDKPIGCWKAALKDLQDGPPERCTAETPCDDWGDCQYNPELI